MLTFQALTYIEGNYQTGKDHVELCQKNPDILEMVLNRIALSNSAMGKCASMQVINNQNMGELQQPRNENDPPFRRTLINS